MASIKASLAASATLVTALLAAPAATAVELAPVDVSPTCAVGVEPVDLSEGDAALAQVPEPVIDCFPTFGAAIEFVTDGEVAAESPAELERVAAASADGTVSTAASVVLGYEYKNTGYSGGSLVLYGSSGSGCGRSTTYGFSSMPAGWNNVISYARSLAGCLSTHYNLTGYGGSRMTCQGACSALGSMNNRTSSIVFRPIGTYG